MSEKKTNLYQVQLKELVLKNEQDAHRHLDLQFNYHDDLFEIFDKVRSKNYFQSEQDMTQFVLGLKLMTAIILKDKENPLFSELKPAIMEFMKKLKQNKE